nr:voltage-dependent calcium channel gamma-3 subunit isoform X2 [Taeniopygia guttata]XP_041575017.1 voltage-dependent calcium channel gamma-3 subunit isoform X2 [Taeniopygia guttata]
MGLGWCWGRLSPSRILQGKAPGRLLSGALLARGNVPRRAAQGSGAAAGPGPCRGRGRSRSRAVLGQRWGSARSRCGARAARFCRRAPLPAAVCALGLGARTEPPSIPAWDRRGWRGGRSSCRAQTLSGPAELAAPRGGVGGAWRGRNRAWGPRGCGRRGAARGERRLRASPRSACVGPRRVSVTRLGESGEMLNGAAAEPRRAAHAGNHKLALGSMAGARAGVPGPPGRQSRSESQLWSRLRFCASARQRRPLRGRLRRERRRAVRVPRGGACPPWPLQRHLLSSVPAVQRGGKHAALWGQSRS